MLAPTLACSRFEAPCEKQAEIELLVEPSLRPGAVSLTETFDGRAILQWLRLEDPPPDAGAPIGREPKPLSLEVAELDATGPPRARYAIPVPSALASREGSTRSVGAVVMRGRALFHWIEETLRTEANGLVRIDSSLRMQLGERESEGRPIALPEAACTDCRLVVAAGSSQTSIFVALFGVPTDTAPAGASPFARVIRFTIADGRVEVLPWPLSIPPPDIQAGDVFRFDVSAARLFVRTTAGTFAIDEEFRPLGPPLPVFGPLNRAFYGDSERGAVAWMRDVDPDDASSTRQHQGLYVQRWVDGGPAGPQSRISTADLARSVVRDGDYLGVSFAAGTRDYFARVGPDGAKIGGDLDLGEGNVSAWSKESAPPRTQTQWLSVVGPGKYSQLTVIGERVLRREVICDP